ncbi:MAG: autotransporter outer membrane beta-barrel domain-containing protein, partial [Desulfovibrio sp.]|nr:autotransporter outer membrane beta-barrel domain-containing protein [Desulfovibrio sp.]
IGTAAYFGKASLLVMTGTALTNGGLNGTGSGALAVADGARLSLVNAQANRTFSVARGFTSASHTGSGWLGNNLSFFNYTVTGSGRFTSDGYTITTTRRNIRQTFPDIIAASSINTMAARGLNDIYSPQEGIRFLSRATEGGLYLAKSDVKNTVNEVSRASVTANVQHTAFRAIESVEDAIEQQLSRISLNTKAVSVHENGWHIWATPLHTNTYTHDMGASGHSVNGHFTGLVVGIGKILGDFTFGVSVNGGGGYSETGGTITETKDSHNFGGANLYAAWSSGSWNVLSSVGFALSNHDVSMNLPWSMGMGSQKAQIHTQAWNANLRAEYVWKTEALDIIPHAGVRFVSLRTFDHDLDDLASYESDPQNIIQFPVGVTFSKDFVAGSWNLSPALDLTFVPTVGNRRAETRVRFTGIDAEDSVKTRVLDDCAFKGSLGLTASKGGFSVGLQYTLKASSHETDHGVQANLMWEF